MRWLILAALVLCSVYDVRGLSVPIWATCLSFVLAGVCLIQRGGFHAYEIILSLIPGILLFLYSLAARGMMGAGDALIIMAVGLGTGFLPAIVAICLAFVLAAVFAAVLIVFFRKGRSFRIPFVPFIATGTGVALWLI